MRRSLAEWWNGFPLFAFNQFIHRCKRSVEFNDRGDCIQVENKRKFGARTHTHTVLSSLVTLENDLNEVNCTMNGMLFYVYCASKLVELGFSRSFS